MKPEFVFCDYRQLPAGRPLPSGPWTWVVYEVTDARLALELAGSRRRDGRVDGAVPARCSTRRPRKSARMTGGLYIAIDQGGHATRASAYDATGTLAGAALVTIATQHNALGHVEHDPEEIVASVRTALAELARIAPVSRWESAGFAVQRSSLVCWDATDGHALSPVISWQDTRNAQWLKGIARRSDDVQRLTGLPLSPHYGASKLRWCLDHLPEVRSAAAQSRLHAGPLASYLLHRLLREQPFLADASTAARTLLWSPFERGWSEELLGLFGIPRAILPRATRHFGRVRDARLRRQVCRGHCLQRRPVRRSICRGSARPRRRLRQSRNRRVRAPRDGRCAACASAAHQRDSRRCGALRFRARGFGQRRGRRTRLARTAPGRCRRTVCSRSSPTNRSRTTTAPFFLNGVAGLASPFWRPDFQSSFVGDGTDLQLCRAVLESVAFLLKANLDEIDRHLPPPARLVASGGLAENRLLCRMLACLAEVPADRGSDREATSRGLAFLVAGEPADFAAPPVLRFEPDPDQSLLARYLKWLELMRGRYRRVTISRVRAPKRAADRSSSGP